tara:strand:- start:27724 stop:33774 length:6051 start_codon:yes stop_codon:yes gene_type:complete
MAFGMSPREAQGIDPQQRLLLETAWEAFEDGGIPLESLENSPTGVFLGGFCLDHLIHIAQPSNRILAGSHSATSASMTILANRLSYAFNLRGPSFTLDTACSSSLVALHCACKSIETGECEMALAGGSNVMMRPEYPIMMSKGQFLSWHGNCRAFDDTAAGYVRGEGAGIVLLKPLQKAIADADSIYAVIQGTGSNQDGRTSGISLPNSFAQEELMQRVYKQAGISPAEVDYVEAHGTGTQAGDPAEARALHSNFAKGRPIDRPLRVGSVKTNIGHLEAAAGIAGVIKTALILKHRKVPQNLHFNNPNPKIPFSDYCLEIASKSIDLPPIEEKEILYAGVNSFGYGGTNAHAILSSPPKVRHETAEARDAQGGLRFFPLSARSPEALHETAGRLAFTIRRNKEMTVEDLQYTLTQRRSHLTHRAGIFATDLKDLRTKLMATSIGEESRSVRIGRESTAPSGKPVFVCTGMGPQWWGMGHELFRSEPIFRQTLEDIDKAFINVSGWSIREEMLKSESDSQIARTEIAQPANFAIQIALARLLSSWGVEPSAIIGHSVGEVSAAYLAGVYTMEEALLVSYHRSRLQGQEAGKGTMLAVGLPEDQMEPYLIGFPGVSIAAVNSFQSVTLSGDQKSLESISSHLKEQEIFNKFLRVEVAYHSPQMDPLREEILAVLETLDPKPPNLPLYSTVSGNRSDGTEWTNEYWWRNVREPVRFAKGISAMLEDGYDLFLEIGPHPVLGNSIREIAADSGHSMHSVPSLRRKEPELENLQVAFADLYNAGASPDWTKISSRGKLVTLPKYPWQRNTYWSESDESTMDRIGLDGTIYLNQKIEAPHPTWEVEINRNFFPFLPDHGIHDQTVFPGMGYVEAALALGKEVYGEESSVLADVDFEKFLIIDPKKIQLLVSHIDPETGSFEIGSRELGSSGTTQRHARGRISRRGEETPPSFDLAEAKELCRKPLPLDTMYEKLNRRGLLYGPTFRPITEIFTGHQCFFATLETEVDLHQADHLMHPTLLDACLQPILYIARKDRLFVPNGMKRMRFFGGSGRRFYAFGRLLRQTDSYLEGQVWLTDESGNAIAIIEQMSCQAIDTEAISNDAPSTYVPFWKEEDQPRKTEVSCIPPAIIIGHTSFSDPSLHQALGGRGIECLMLDDSKTRDLLESKITEVLPEGGRVIITLGTANQRETADYERILKCNLVFLEIIQAISKRSSAMDLTVLTRGGQPSADPISNDNREAYSLPALGTLAANESPSVRFRSIELGTMESEECAKKVWREIANGSLGEIAFHKNVRSEKTLRRSDLPEAPVRMAEQSVDEPIAMTLSGAQRIESISYRNCNRREPGEKEVEIRIHSSALNYKDYLKVVGRLSTIATKDTYFEDSIGMECIGEVVRAGNGFEPVMQVGQTVIGFAQNAFSSYATTQASLLVPAPREAGPWAAGITVVYLTAVHGLERLANLSKGERVLIHQATGGLGMAAIQVARRIGAQIFVTAGSEEKRSTLRSMGIEHVYASRDLSFSEGIRKATNGEGVDVVLSALAGPAQHESLSLLRSGGRFIEVGKKDIIENSGLPLRSFNRNILFASVDIDRLILERPILIKEMLQEIVGRFDRGEFQPDPGQLFPANQIQQAFQLMAQSQHRGKILLDYRKGSVDIPSSPRQPGRIRSDGSYLVTGGTSGFGLETAKWLCRQGAGRVILLSRRGMDSDGLRETLNLLDSEDTEIVVEQGDVTDPLSLQPTAAKMSSDGFTPAGVIHGAMVLDDSPLLDMESAKFSRVFEPKVKGLLNLLEELPSAELDFFLCYSSISSLIGNRAQSNYVAANAILDATCHDLRSKGVPALSINWGALSESGVVARSSELGGILESAGITGLSNQEALTVLEKSLAADLPQVAAFSLDWEKWQDSHPALNGDPRFAEHVERASGGEEDPVLTELRQVLESHPPEEQIILVEERLASGLSAVLKIPPDQIKPESKLSEMGVDSLLLLELSLELKARTGVSISAMEFLKGPSLRDLGGIVLTRAGLTF